MGRSKTGTGGEVNNKETKIIWKHRITEGEKTDQDLIYKCTDGVIDDECIQNKK